MVSFFLRPAAATSLAAAVAACAGSAYLPSNPGGANSDLSGNDVRESWVADHPEVSEEIRAAILEGVFVPGMTVEQRDVISNPRRQGRTGNGFWRASSTDDELRYRWYVAGEREPFDDGRGRLVCELVYVGGRLDRVRYCAAVSDRSEPDGT